MRNSFVALLAFTPAIVLCAGAVYLASIGAAGWGWFLFVALLIGGSVSIKDKA